MSINQTSDDLMAAMGCLASMLLAGLLFGVVIGYLLGAW